MANSGLNKVEPSSVGSLLLSAIPISASMEAGLDYEAEAGSVDSSGKGWNECLWGYEPALRDVAHMLRDAEMRGSGLEGDGAFGRRKIVWMQRRWYELFLVAIRFR